MDPAVLYSECWGIFVVLNNEVRVFDNKKSFRKFLIKNVFVLIDSIDWVYSCGSYWTEYDLLSW